MEKRTTKKINKGVEIITYPDSLGGNLKNLKHILDKHFKSVIKGVHILPFYPSSSDRGFAPLTHRKIDPKYGNESDLAQICKDYDVMADLIVNHVSKDSNYFQDYLRNGDNSKYRNYFIEAHRFSRRFQTPPHNKILRYFYFTFGQILTFLRGIDFILHKHGVNKLVLKKIYRPKPGSPFIKFIGDDGKKKYICWCTFSPEQIDLNIKSSAVRKKFARDIKYLNLLGVKYIRLDAVAYTGKMRGTNNFLIPQTINFIGWLSKQAHQNEMKVVPEVHFDYKTQISLSDLPGVDYVYDFSLPFLLIHAVYSGEAEYLYNWINIRPKNSISNLDTHDGIGVVDVMGLLPEEEIKKISTLIFEAGGNAAKRASGNNSSNLDIYQINCTYYSALGEDDNLYLMARAIQLFLPGIPQIYYVGFLAGKNDTKLLKETGIGRSINRHDYTLDEVNIDINKKVVKRLFRLCKIRNNNKSFNGNFTIKQNSPSELSLLWKHGREKLELIVDFDKKIFLIYDNDRELFI